MTRDEAKKMAEEWARNYKGGGVFTATYKLTEADDRVIMFTNPKSISEHEELGAIVENVGDDVPHLIDAYMACYDAMTKGKPDGWCAWHPIMGFDAPTFETERRLIVNRGIESCVDKGASWAVKPVKLIKVEGSSK